MPYPTKLIRCERCGKLVVRRVTARTCSRDCNHNLCVRRWRVKHRKHYNAKQVKRREAARRRARMEWGARAWERYQKKRGGSWGPRPSPDSTPRMAASVKVHHDTLLVFLQDLQDYSRGALLDHMGKRDFAHFARGCNALSVALVALAKEAPEESWDMAGRGGVGHDE